jgi:hypothetical protein
MNPYLGDRVRTPWSDKTVGTVINITGGALVYVRFDRPCGPGPDSEGLFNIRDLRPAETEEQTIDEGHKRINEWWFSRLDEVRRERDEAIEKLKTMEQLDILTTQRARLAEQGYHRHERKLRAQRDEARAERDEAIKKLRRAVRVLTGVDSTT